MASVPDDTVEACTKCWTWYPAGTAVCPRCRLPLEVPVPALTPLGPASTAQPQILADPVNEPLASPRRRARGRAIMGLFYTFVEDVILAAVFYFNVANSTEQYVAAVLCLFAAGSIAKVFRTLPAQWLLVVALHGFNCILIFAMFSVQPQPLRLKDAILIYALTIFPLFLTVTRIRNLAIVWPDQKEAVDRVARSPLNWAILAGTVVAAAALIAVRAH